MKKKAKILYLHHQARIGGAERSLLTLFSGLDRERYEIAVACPSEGRFAEELIERQIRLYGFIFPGIRHVWKLCANVLRIVQLVKAEHFDLIHSNSPQTNIPGGLAARVSGLPAVWHARTLIEPGMVDLDRVFAALAAHIICNSQAIRNRFLGIRRYDEKTSKIINAVDIQQFCSRPVSKETARSKAGLDADGFMIGIFDRLEPRKDHQTVIRAFAEVRTIYPECRLLIVGEGFDRHEERKAGLEKLAQELGLGTAVSFLGFRKDVSVLMSACDVIVLAARNEGCSRVLCEAQAVGRPVVAADDGGNRELVEDGSTGFLFPVGDAAILARLLCRLFSSPEEMIAMGEAAREKALGDFSLSRYCQQTMLIYERILI